MDSSLDKLAPALVGLQADLKPVEKTAANPFFKSKYADLPSVMEAVQPLLAKHKLAVSQFVTNLDGQSALRTILLHESGQSLQDVQPLLLAKQDAQGQGSAITYARRYGVMAVLGVVADEDDDGNAASHTSAPKRAAAGSSNPASDKQLGLLRSLMEKASIDPAAINARLALIETSKEASDAIEKMQAKLEASNG